MTKVERIMLLFGERCSYDEISLAVGYPRWRVMQIVRAGGWPWRGGRVMRRRLCRLTCWPVPQWVRRVELRAAA